MKKFLAMILAAMMLLALAAPLAADDDPPSITIQNSKEGVQYKIYRILDMHSYDATKNAYAYKTNTTWENFILSDDGKVYFKTLSKDSDNRYFVEWNTDVTTDAIRAMTNKAVEYIEAKSIAPVATKPGTGSAITFENLPMGYYVINTSLGTICSLTTVAPHATVYEKNAVPKVDKFVQEDSKIGKTDEWGDTNHADIGQVVKFKSIVNVAVDPHTDTDGDKNDTNTSLKGAYKYVLHDRLSAGLTLLVSEDNPINIYYIKDDGNEETPAAARVLVGQITDDSGKNLTIVARKDVTGKNLGTFGQVSDTYYESCEGATDSDVTDDVTGDKNCTFYIKFNDEYIKTLGLYDQLVVEYSAELNKDAKVGVSDDDKDGVADGNPNKTWLTYGKENLKTAEADTITYTYEFGIYKFANETSGNTTVETPLAGAEFTLTRKGETAAMLFIDENDGSYRVPTIAEMDDDDVEKTTTLISPATTGLITLIGLDAGEYSLRETKAPAGYNKLELDVNITVSAAGVDRTDVTTDESTEQIKIENKKGSILPSTGGIGTTIFYIVGGLMMAAAVVLLVTKRKMAAEEND